MAIVKPAVLPPWADTAGAGNISQPSNAQITQGWPLTSTKPSRQWFNWVLNYCANGVRYMVRRGIPDWDTLETYAIGDRVQSANQCWRALVASTGVTPVGNPATWEEFALGLPALNGLYGRLAVANTWVGNQTIPNAISPAHALPLGQADARYVLAGATFAPIGAIVPHAGGATPVGHLMCDGSAVSRSTFAGLYGQIGTLWGAGNGTTTFNVPDFRGRALIGSGTGTGLSARAAGQSGGAETHALSIAEMPAHTHTTQVANTVDGSASAQGDGGTGSPLATSSTGGSAAHNNMQPFAVVIWLIKT